MVVEDEEVGLAKQAGCEACAEGAVDPQCGELCAVVLVQCRSPRDDFDLRSDVGSFVDRQQTLCAETLWCGHVFADLERQTHFGEFIRHRERPAGVSLDAVQKVPDGVRVNMQLGGGIGDRSPYWEATP